MLTLLWALVVLRVLWFVPRLTERLQPQPWGRAFVVLVTFVVLAAIYEAVFVLYSSGQTPGKDLLNIRVVGPGQDGAVGAGRALARALPVLTVPVIRPVWAAIAILVTHGLTSARPGRRSIVDALAGVIIVPYDRDQEDPTARRPIARHHRRAIARDEPSPANRATAVPTRTRPIGDLP